MCARLFPLQLTHIFRWQLFLVQTASNTLFISFADSPSIPLKSISHFHLAESQINKVWIILWGASFCFLKTCLFAVISHLFVCSAKTGWGLLGMILAAGAHFYLKSLLREKKCKLKIPDTAAKNLSFLQILWRCKNESRKINLGRPKVCMISHCLGNISSMVCWKKKSYFYLLTY